MAKQKANHHGNGTNDCFGHGTHVADTLGGTTYGVAKEVTLHPVRVLDCFGNGFISDVVAGIDWVTANHQSPAVANMSMEITPTSATCDGGQAANTDTPALLTITAERTAVTGSQIAVPVTFTPNGAAVTTVAFALHFDANYLTLDPADQDENGMPDAIAVNQPESDMALQVVEP